MRRGSTEPRVMLNLLQGPGSVAVHCSVRHKYVQVVSLDGSPAEMATGSCAVTCRNKKKHSFCFNMYKEIIPTSQYVHNSPLDNGSSMSSNQSCIMRCRTKQDL